MIYQPSDDSYLLEKELKKYAKNKSVLDLGSGSGIQALSALNAGAKSVVATDINQEAVKELRKKGLKAIHSDLFEKVTGKFDLIVFNPPYLPLDEREPIDSRLATTGGKNGDEIILKFLKNSIKHLNKDGTILILLSSLTPKKNILSLLKKLKLTKKKISELKISFELLEVWKLDKKV